jgi:hypothetical protein
MPDNQVTAALEEIRKLDRTWARPRSPDDVPRLLAAIDAVLKLAEEATEVRDYSGYETHGRLVGWRLSPAAVHEAISSALLGSQTAQTGKPHA